VIDKHDAVVNDHADQNHNPDHCHEREGGAGCCKKQKYAENREHDRSEDDRERQYHGLEQRCHDEEDTSDAEKNIGGHHVGRFVLTLEAPAFFPAVAGRQFDLFHQTVDSWADIVGCDIFFEIGVDDDRRLAIGTLDRVG